MEHLLKQLTDDELARMRGAGARNARPEEALGRVLSAHFGPDRQGLLETFRFALHDASLHDEAFAVREMADRLTRRECAEAHWGRLRGIGRGK
jgi:hypothetical protein